MKIKFTKSFQCDGMTRVLYLWDHLIGWKSVSNQVTLCRYLLKTKIWLSPEGLRGINLLPSGQKNRGTQMLEGLFSFRLDLLYILQGCLSPDWWLT